MRPARYVAADTNGYGLALLAGRLAAVEGRHADVLEGASAPKADVVYSVGLIEHFDREGTRRAVETHFESAREFVLLSYPTPTWLYRVARAAAEAVGLWRFPDERPLARAEVMEAVGPRGELIEERLLWPLVFTQRMMLFRVTPRRNGRDR
ncbi:MAG TPA: class I SAM-dependent methyltransferase [Solibacterales bacterium]|nr:class I SAM-dependent methyltransferase [Bryobacterales bacterium]